MLDADVCAASGTAVVVVARYVEVVVIIDVVETTDVVMGSVFSVAVPCSSASSFSQP